MMAGFHVEVLPDRIVVHTVTSHRFSFDRGPRQMVGIVTFTPSHGTDVFASSIDENAEAAGLAALCSSPK
jgi:hypothetical protein